MWNDYIKVVEKVGVSSEETELIDGVILEKERTHQSMPNRVDEVRIVLASFPLEIKVKESKSRAQGNGSNS